MNQRTDLMLRTVTAAVVLGPLLVLLLALEVVWGAFVSWILVGILVVFGFGLSGIGVDITPLLEPLTAVILIGSFTLWGWTAYSSFTSRVEAARADLRVTPADSVVAYATDVEPLVERTAAQFSVRVPTVRVVDSDTTFGYLAPGVDEDEADDAGPQLVVSTVLVDSLEADELRAVVAHELAHFANRDLQWTFRFLIPWTLVQKYTDVVGDPDIGTEFVGPLLGWWARNGVGPFLRGREYAADRAAAELVGSAALVATTLQKLSESGSAKPMRDRRRVALAGSLSIVFPQDATHEDTPYGLVTERPSIESRVRRLRQ